MEKGADLGLKSHVQQQTLNTFRKKNSGIYTLPLVLLLPRTDGRKRLNTCTYRYAPHNDVSVNDRIYDGGPIRL
jgi:hypothetical protein